MTDPYQHDDINPEEAPSDTEPVDEIRRLRDVLQHARRDRADLAAAARATIAAFAADEPDPLYYLRDELEAQGFGEPSR